MLTILLFLLQTASFSGGESEIEKLFSTQESKSIANYFSNSIDLDIPSAKGTYSKDQATIIFQSFIKEHSIKQYIKKHSGGGNGRSKFEIGSLQLNEKTYRTYVLYDVKEEKLEIIELRIE